MSDEQATKQVGAHRDAPGDLHAQHASAVDFDYEDATTIKGRGGISATERTIGGLRLRRAFDAMAGHTGRCILLGCGAGRHNRAIYAARPDLTMVGADLSISAIQEAVREGLGGEYV